MSLKSQLHESCPKESMDILLALKSAQFESYFAGGAVRDLLLGCKVHDFDIVTSATPDQVASLFGKTKLVGSNFAVSLVKVGDVTTECSTMRLDGAYSDGRRPDSVQYTTNMREDLARRDFTINALLMDENGEVFDYVDGLMDLQNGILRTVGDPNRRFTEDSLRLLRAVRFAIKLNFRIDSATDASIRNLAHYVTKLSGERVRDELSKMLMGPNPNSALVLMDDLGLLKYVLPEVCAMKGVDQNPKHHQHDVFNHTMMLLQNLPEKHSLELALGVLFHDIAKPVTAVRNPDTGHNTFYGHEDVGAELTEQILRRLVFPMDVINVVVGHVKQHMKFFTIESMRKAKLSRFVRQDNFDDLLELHRLDCLASDGQVSTAYDYVKDFLSTVSPAQLRPTKLLTGDDLLLMGLTPGPQFRVILEAVETAQLEGRVSTREEALELVKSYVL